MNKLLVYAGEYYGVSGLAMDNFGIEFGQIRRAYNERATSFMQLML